MSVSYTNPRTYLDKERDAAIIAWLRSRVEAERTSVSALLRELLYEAHARETGLASGPAPAGALASVDPEAIRQAVIEAVAGEVLPLVRGTVEAALAGLSVSSPAPAPALLDGRDEMLDLLASSVILD